MSKKYTDQELLNLAKKILAQQEKSRAREKAGRKALLRLKEAYPGEYQEYLQEDLKSPK